MSRAFYPFVEEGMDEELKAHYATRIAIYDDAAAAPRVVVIDPTDVRAYLEEITSEVSRLSREMGGHIPFMVIREVVENLIHAYFIEPAISILDQGDTIRFADQGPGIKEKDRALEYGTTSATEEMKKYIRGVGSGLPYAQQYLEDHGGSLRIEDNIAGGTIVTISMKAKKVEPEQAEEPSQGMNPLQQAGQMMPGYPMQQMAPAYPMQGMQQMGAYPAQGMQPMGYPQQAMQQMGAGYPAQPGYQQVPTQQMYPEQAAQMPHPAQPEQQEQTGIELSWRGQQVLAYLAEHESVGPTDLVEAYGSSQPTWTRESCRRLSERASSQSADRSAS